MGLDLTLCPYDWSDGFGDNVWWLTYTRIGLRGGARAFAEQLEASQLPVHLLPPGAQVEWYGDEGLKKTREDPYGEPLTFMRAGDLVKLEMPPSKRWAAAWAYLKALPPETPILLWWH